MNTKGNIAKLLDELIAGNPRGTELENHLDLILTWLAHPDADSVSDFRHEYQRRNITDEILRGYVLFVLEQKLFANDNQSAYQTLGLSITATQQQVKSRYHKLIRIYHPDRGLADASILHKHTEKIIKAYKNITTDSDLPKKARQAQTAAQQSFVDNKIDATAYPDHFVIRKVRSKLGDAQQFQVLFFAGIAAICLFAIALIYFQSLNSDQVETRYVKQESQNNPKMLTATESQQPLLSEKQENQGQPIEEQQFESDQAVDNLVNTEKEQTGSVDIDSSLQELTNESNTVVDNKSDSQIDLEEVKDQNELQGSVDKLDNDENATQLLDPKQLTATESVVMENVDQDPAENVVLQEKEVNTKPTFSGLSANKTDNNNNSASDQKTEKIIHKDNNGGITKVIVKKTLKKSKNQTNKVQQPTVAESNLNSRDVISGITNEPAAESEIDEDLNSAPVKEIIIGKIVKSPNRPQKANLFEQRFARNFVIKYLESIEKGNISLINDFLSDTLAVNGVSNTKFSYLKNTTQLINKTNKRAYSIKFLGDVLRLDKGSFRVTLREQQTFIYKNNTKTQKSYTKRYDIIRYRHGSEIVSISDV